jgi:hypothetical protein
MFNEVGRKFCLKHPGSPALQLMLQVLMKLVVQIQEEKIFSLDLKELYINRSLFDLMNPEKNLPPVTA